MTDLGPLRHINWQLHSRCYQRKMAGHKNCT